MVSSRYAAHRCLNNGAIGASFSISHETMRLYPFLRKFALLLDALISHDNKVICPMFGPLESIVAHAIAGDFAGDSTAAWRGRNRTPELTQVQLVALRFAWRYK